MRKQYSENEDNVVIYQIIIKDSDGKKKKYIGVTKANPPEKRFKLHLKIANNIEHYKTKNKVYPVHYAIAKYGIDNVKFSILEKVNGNLKEGFKREIYWINKLKTHINFGKGYNVTFGGDGVLHTKEMRETKSLKMRQRRDAGQLWNKVLSSEQALEIKQLIMGQTLTNREIAKNYNCHVTTVGEIARNEIFKDILKDTPILEHGKNGWFNTGYKNRKGSNNNASKFSENEIRKIRKLRTEGFKIKDLALKFKVSLRCIIHICNYKTYKNIV
jgi:hypothetical protein